MSVWHHLTKEKWKWNPSLGNEFAPHTGAESLEAMGPGGCVHSRLTEQATEQRFSTVHAPGSPGEPVTRQIPGPPQKAQAMSTQDRARVYTNPTSTEETRRSGHIAHRSFSTSQPASFKYALQALNCFFLILLLFFAAHHMEWKGNSGGGWGGWEGGRGREVGVEVEGRMGEECSPGSMFVCGDTVLECDGCWFAPSIRHLLRHRWLDYRFTDPHVHKTGHRVLSMHLWSTMLKRMTLVCIYTEIICQPPSKQNQPMCLSHLEQEAVKSTLCSGGSCRGNYFSTGSIGPFYVQCWLLNQH